MITYARSAVWLVIAIGCSSAEKTIGQEPSSRLNVLYGLATFAECDDPGAVRWENYDGGVTCTAGMPFVGPEEVVAAEVAVEGGHLHGVVEFSEAGAAVLAEHDRDERWAVLIDSRVTRVVYIRTTFDGGGHSAPIDVHMDPADALRVAELFRSRYPEPLPRRDLFAIVPVHATPRAGTKAMLSFDGSEYHVGAPLVDARDLRDVEARATDEGLILSVLLEDSAADHLTRVGRELAGGDFGLVVGSWLVRVMPLPAPLTGGGEWMVLDPIPMPIEVAQQIAEEMRDASDGD